MSEPRLYVMWRIDGEFNLTDLPVIHRDKSTNELVELCIRMDSEDDDDEIAHQIAMATDSDHPDFMGYEMPLIMVSADVEFIQT
jgi:hypothetical protein